MGVCLLAMLDHYYLCTNESSHSCVGLMGFYLLAVNRPLSADGALSPSPSLF